MNKKKIAEVFKTHTHTHLLWVYDDCNCILLLCSDRYIIQTVFISVSSFVTSDSSER